MVRQLSYEADRVGDEDLRLADVHLSRQWIERREETVFYENILAARKAGQDRGLAGIRVANERRLELALPRLALHDASFLHVAQTLLEKLDAAIDQPAVRLELRLAGTAHADAAAVFLEVGPHSR